MQPIVNGIKKEFKACLHLERVNLSSETQWHVLLSPIGTPEFALLDSSDQIIYRWIGFTEKEQFVEVMKPLCG
jgi:thioredoxin-related protein